MTSRSAGITLVEVLLSVAITTILVGSLVSFAIVSATSRAKAEAITEVEQQAAFVEQFLNRTIREADSVTSPLAGSSASSLSLAMPAGVPSPVIFTLVNDTLQVVEGSSMAEQLHSNQVQMSNLTFYNATVGAGAGSVQYRFTLTATNPTGRNEFSYTRTYEGAGSLR